MKSLAAIQSSYVPWRGYFDVIAQVDEFVLLDEVQYTKRDWRNRNRIKGPDGPRWITIPVNVKGRYRQRIDEVTIADPDWARSHLDSLRQAYSGAAAFADEWPAIEAAYRDASRLDRLSEVNRLFLVRFCERLGIATPIRWSTDYESAGTSTERLVSLCRAAGATEYVTGPAARDYLDERLFAEHAIEVSWVSYEGYESYPQGGGDFVPDVSVLDLLFHTGAEAPNHLKHAAPARR